METKGSILMKKYEVGKMLGQGNFAKVYHARNLETGTSVAIKVIDKDKILKTGMMDQIKREISSMRLVGHTNVVHLFEVMASKTKIYFVMEYVRGGELFNKVAKGKLREDAARKYFRQLIYAVDFCHSRGVCHRDLKPENLLLDEDGNLKVSDFGLSTLADSKREDGLLHTTCGTPAYVAPEVINRRGYDGSRADIWSCGVILFVLLSGYLPFHDSNLMEMYRKIGKAEFKYPNWIAPDARRLISKMLDPNPRTRISISKIMQSSWFRRGMKSEPRATSADNPKVEDMKEGEKETMETIFSLDEISNVEDTKVESSSKLTKMNAFDLISLSAGFDLSGLFVDSEQKKEFKFTSNQSAKTIVSKFEEVCKKLKLKIAKKEGGILKLEGTKEGRKGVLCIDAEIYEVTPNFHMVEMNMSNGDTLEYLKMMKQEVRPSLEDIVWAWQGEEPGTQPHLDQQHEILTTV